MDLPERLARAIFADDANIAPDIDALDNHLSRKDQTHRLDDVSHAVDVLASGIRSRSRAKAVEHGGNLVGRRTAE